MTISVARHDECESDLSMCAFTWGLESVNSVPMLLDMMIGLCVGRQGGYR